MCRGGGLEIGQMSVHSIKKMGKDFCPNSPQPLLENIDRRSCNGGSRELIPVFHNPHRKGRTSPSAVALTLKYLVGVPSKASSSGREKKQVLVHIQKTRTVFRSARNRRRFKE